MSLPHFPSSLLEQLAELEHDQWSHWIKYQASQKELAWLDFFNKTKKPQFNSAVMERWILLSRTPYSKLTEKEKESDREWAKKVLAILSEWKLSMNALMRTKKKLFLKVVNENTELKKGIREFFEWLEFTYVHKRLMPEDQWKVYEAKKKGLLNK